MAGSKTQSISTNQRTVVQAINALSNKLKAISLDIHAHPELNYQERYAAKLLSDFLEGQGFEVERKLGGVETAFRAVAKGNGSGPRIAILAEYDALPGIGHGCGHNLIALTAIGAVLGAKAATKLLPGSIEVIGTPAEEGGGGKIRLLEAGVFKGVDIALSSHPSSNTTIIPSNIEPNESWSLAMVGYRYAFHGKAAHAAVAPWEGVNALNAVIHLFTGIDALRQHLREDVRIHGIITDGGKAPNVVPDFAAANFMLRSKDGDYLKQEVVEKVKQVAEGAARITGARLEILPAHPFYENVWPNGVLADLAKRYAPMVGLPLDEPVPGKKGSGASTDFGNVSQIIPSFAISFGISDKPVPGHSVAMAEAASTDKALESAIAVAKVLALMTCELLSNRKLLNKVSSDFAARSKTDK